jgi:hypothetical protein
MNIPPVNKFTQIRTNFSADAADKKYLFLRKSALNLRKSARNFFMIAFLVQSLANAQDTVYLKYAKTITKEDLSAHVYKLASDDMEGRFTGSRGQIKAQKYIKDNFKADGLAMPVINGSPTYSQEFMLNDCRWKDQRLMIDGKRLKVGRDFLFLCDPINIHGDYPVLYAGFGIEDSAYNDFGNIDLTGKIMLAFAGEPRREGGISMISGDLELSKKGYYFSKTALASEKGAEGVFIISRSKSDYKKYLKERDYYNPKPHISYPGKDDDELKHKEIFSAYMNVKTAAELVDQSPKTLLASLREMESTGRSDAGKFSGQVRVDATSNCFDVETGNVIGIVEGTDLKTQAVVVVAHYDHLGEDNKGIYHGADDNASGTAAVMEIAQAFAAAAKDGIRPRRTVIFLAVSGEELGLFGSKYYSQNPVISLDSTYACLNIDMIGRASNRQLNDPGYIGGYVYESPDLLAVSQHVCSQVAPELEDQIEYKKFLRGGSDHYYFAKHGIPSLFYFEGFHPDYHEVTDTPDKVLYDRMEKIVRVIYATAWELANSTERMKNEE